MTSRFGTVRVLRWGGLMSLLAMTVGAKGGCETNYDLVSDVTIDAGNRHWERLEIQNRRTHGWAAHGLLPVAGPVFVAIDYEGAPTVMATARITALGSREFFVFSRASDPLKTFGTISDTWHRSAVSGTAARTNFRVNMARFIDHGACRSRVPFKQDDGKGLLQIIQKQVDYSFHKKIVEKGSTATTQAWAIQTSFFLADPANPKSTEVRDGFGMAFHITAHVDVLHDLDIKFGLSYALLRDNHGFASASTLPGARVSVYHPASEADGLTLGAEVSKALNETLPGKLRTIALYGNADAGVKGRAQTTLVPCAGQAENFCGTSPLARNFFVGLLRDVGKLDNTIAVSIANSLSPEGFECRKRIEDIDDGEADINYDRCWWHPAAKRVNVMPDSVELVWSDPEAPEPGDVRLVNTLSPGTMDCTQWRTTSAGQNAGDTYGNLDEMYEGLDL